MAKAKPTTPDLNIPANLPALDPHDPGPLPEPEARGLSTNDRVKLLREGTRAYRAVLEQVIPAGLPTLLESAQSRLDSVAEIANRAINN